MGVPTSEVGYISATAGGGTTKSERTCGGTGGEKKKLFTLEVLSHKTRHFQYFSINILDAVLRK